MINFDNIVASSSSHKATEVSAAGDIFGSLTSRNFRSSYIVAYWAKADGRIRQYNDMSLTPQPGVIKFFIKRGLMVGDQSCTHWFVYCDWFLSTAESIKKKCLANRLKFGTKISLHQQGLLHLYQLQAY